jgi:hypothetical protein
MFVVTDELRIKECVGGWMEILATNDPPSRFTCGPFNTSDTTYWQLNKDSYNSQAWCGPGTCVPYGLFGVEGAHSHWRTAYFTRDLGSARDALIICSSGANESIKTSCRTNTFSKFYFIVVVVVVAVVVVLLLLCVSMNVCVCVCVWAHALPLRCLYMYMYIIL